MKKKFTVIISLLIAFVMSFALIACGDDGGQNATPSKPPVLSSALAKLKSADGYKGGLTFAAETRKKGKTVDFAGTVEKRGSKFEAVAGEGATADRYIFDADTGYLYNKTDNGYYFEQLLPAGVVDYAQFMAEKLIENADGKTIDDLFVYDDKTRTATYEFDGAAIVNAYLAPVQSAYKNNSNFVTLINNYLKLTSPDPTRPYTLEGVIDMAITFLVSQPNATVGQIIEVARAQGIDVYELLESSGLLEKSGITLDEPTKTAIEARKFSEFVVALNELLAEVKDNPQILQNPSAVMNKLFIEDVTVTDYRASLNSLKNMLIALLTVQEVKPVVDKYMGGGASAYLKEMYAVIKNGVQAERFDATVTVKYDENNNIIGIAASGNFAHDFDGDATGFAVLSDNNYKFDFALDIVEYLTAPDAFEITFASDAWGKNSINTVIAVVYGSLDSDVEVYVETCGKDVEMIVSRDTAYMTYDAEKHAFKFDMQAIKELYAAEIRTGTFRGVDAAASVAGANNVAYIIRVEFMPDTPEGLFERLGEILEKEITPPEIGDGSVARSVL